MPAESTLNDFGVPSGYRALISGSYYLRIPVQPNEYARLVEGEKPKYADTFTSTYYSPRLARVGFRVSTKLSQLPIFACLEYVAKISASTTYTDYTAIQVLDYCRPEVEDVRAGLMAVPKTAPFTVRYGMINVDESSGFVGIDPEELYVDEGFTFSFMESSKRLVV